MPFFSMPHTLSQGVWWYIALDRVGRQGLDKLQELVPPLLELCHRAGQEICAHYHSSQAGEYEAKGDDSPLTQADMASHHLLEAGLLAIAPGLPILSEESPEMAFAERSGWSRFWLVDPLDGTKEFLARTGEFTINIALVENSRPILGVLYLPLEDKAYIGIPGEMAACYLRLADGSWDSKAISTRSLGAVDHLALLASRRHRGEILQQCLDWLGGNWGSIERYDSGSALKFCRLAEGEGDFYPRFSLCCEWDTAAGDAILEAAGGAILGLDGQPLRYNCRDTLYSPWFYAIADPAHPLWTELIKEGVKRNWG
jgi:3'(2'), 5'-bisphosphate nucleotidase